MLNPSAYEGLWVNSVLYVLRVFGVFAAGWTLSFGAFASEGQISSQALTQAHKDHRTGYIHHVREDYQTAILWYEKGAAAGLAKSELGIGRILAFDRGEQRDYVKALPWFIRAAEPRSKPQGYGFEEAQRQAQQALDWYCRKGPAAFPQSHALSKDPKCWVGRGKALMSGKRGVTTDYAQAQALLEQAVAAGRIEALSSLTKAKNLNAPEPPRDYAKIAWALAALLLFTILMRLLRWRQRLFWLIHNFSA